MKKKYVVLRFKMWPLIINLHSEQELMLDWCKKKGFEMQNEFSKDAILVKFERDKKTLDFIKEFLEWKVRHALPFDSLTTIPGIEVVDLDN